MQRAQEKRQRSKYAIPESKFYTPHKARRRSEEREGNLAGLLDLWEEKFEMDIAGLVEQATDDGYGPKFEGWQYSNIRRRSEQQLSCRVAFVSTDRRSKLFATYEFFPFLDNKVVPVSPSEKESPARILLDGILAGAGYNIDESYRSKAA